MRYRIRVLENDLRHILWHNLETLWRTRFGEGPLVVDKLAEHLKIPLTTLQRIAKRTSYARSDTIATLARQLRVEPWQLLVPNFGEAGRRLMPIDAPSAGEAELVRLFRAMDPDTRPALLARARSLHALDAGAQLPAPKKQRRARKTPPPPAPKRC